MRREHGLHRRLVHADGGGQHAGADVRHVRQLEHSLDGAVLAIGAVQHDDDHVETRAQLRGHPAGRLDADECVGGERDVGAFGAIGERFLDGAGGVAARQADAGLRGQGAEGITADDPAAVTADPDGDDGMAPVLQRRHHRGGGGERDLVLAGPPAEDHAHAERGHAPHSSRRRPAAFSGLCRPGRGPPG